MLSEMQNSTLNRSGRNPQVRPKPSSPLMTIFVYRSILTISGLIIYTTSIVVLSSPYTTSIVYHRPILHLSSPIVVLSNIYRRLLSSYPTSIVVLHVRIYLSVVSGYRHPLLCTILCVCPSVLVFLFHHLCGREGEL